MDNSRDELLRPTLSDLKGAKAPYSVGTTLLTSFFGGPFAAIAMTFVNSLRLQRIKRDIIPLALVSIGYIAFIVALYWTDWGSGIRTEIVGFLGERGIVIFIRAIGLLLVGLGYLLHRKEQRSADFMGLKRPNGWIGGLACLAVGVILQVALLTILLSGATQ